MLDTRVGRGLGLLLGVLLMVSGAVTPVEQALAEGQQATKQGPDLFMDMMIGSRDEKVSALQAVIDDWDGAYVPMALETMYLTREPQIAGLLLQVMKEKTGEDFGFDMQRWWQWVWSRPAIYGDGYADFKSDLYGLIDPAFAGYFAEDRTTQIRLDEVVWGGVRQDGIPPLRQPKMIPASEAGYLDDDNVVFGLTVNGDMRAYPKRILAWHEMFVDDVGGVPVAGVYCTLCGTMILYRTDIDGTNHQMGTSGFLYRSNKLMYDQATQSMWNTIWGRPVIGPLADRDIELERMSVVTTTWGEWRRRHPETMVLSPDTGHERDYAEGAAYRDYFATDDLMFAVPELDERLNNKDEVVGLVFAAADRPLAISADFLSTRPVYHDRMGTLDLVVMTDPSGANRVYKAGGRVFADYDGDRTATDELGVRWTLSEAELTAPDGQTLARLPAHRAFWFGWFSAYSNTRLVQ